MSPGSGTGWRAEVQDDNVRLHGQGFGVVFRKVGDRWTDAILRPGSATELARSLIVPQAMVNPARVANPVYQEVQLHGPTTGPSVCLLLTGLWDTHHFSAAVSLATDSGDPPTVQLEFDIADRCRSAVESLAATYMVDLDSGALEAADAGRIVWSLEAPMAGRLVLEAGPGASLALAEAGRKATRVQVVAAILAGTFTHRLRYGWRWTSAEGCTR